MSSPDQEGNKYNPYKTYGTSGGTGPTTVPSGSYDIYLPKSIANEPIFVGTSTYQHPTYGRGDSLPAGVHPGSDGPVSENINTVTATKLVQGYAGMSVTDPQSFAAVQALLYSSGAYGSSKPLWGVWTDKDSAAFGSAVTSYLQVANAGAPITFTEWLGKAATQGQKDGKTPGGTGVTQHATLTDPASIREAAQSAAQQALGHALTDGQLNAFVASFQGQQKSAELSTGQTVTAPDLSSDALQYAQQQDPQGYQSRQHDSYVNALLNMFLPSESARPNITPVPYIGGGPAPVVTEMPQTGSSPQPNVVPLARG